MPRIVQSDGVAKGHPRSTLDSTRQLGQSVSGRPVMTEEELLASGFKTFATAAALVFTLQPVSVSVGADVGTATFTVAASGSGPLTYQWTVDGIDIPGATSTTYAKAVTLADNGKSFACRVTNPNGSLLSTSAILTATVAAPVITTEPVDATVAAGVQAAFTVAATGTLPLSYQWRKNGVDLAGKTSPTLTINTVPADNGNIYSCTVTNAAGTASSESATLSVSYTSLSISNHPANRTVIPNASTTFSVVASSSHAISYQWREDGVDIPGATSATLALSNLQLADSGAVYTCRVSTAFETVVSNGGTLIVHTPVSITTQPTNQSASEGGGVTFTVVATGTGPLTYQWKKDGIDVSGATSASLVLSGIAMGDNGAAYTCVVTGPYSSATSNAATLTVTSSPTMEWHDLRPGSVASPWGGTYLYSVAVANNGQTLLAGDGYNSTPATLAGKLMRSLDGGATWTQLGALGRFALCVISDDGQIIVHSVGNTTNNSGSIMYSTDGGANFYALYNTYECYGLSLSGDGNTLHVLLTANGTPYYARFANFRTSTSTTEMTAGTADARDFFATATGYALLPNTASPCLRIRTANTLVRSIGSINGVGGIYSAACSNDGQIIYAAVIGNAQVAKSVDGGVTWTTVPSSLDTWGRVRCSADGQTVYAISTGGNVRASYDGGATWSALTYLKGCDYLSMSGAPDGCVAMVQRTDGAVYARKPFAGGLPAPSPAALPSLSGYAAQANAGLLLGAALEIRYTADGSDPTQASPLLTDSILQNQAVAVSRKLRTYMPGRTPSAVVTASYTPRVRYRYWLFELMSNGYNGSHVLLNELELFGYSQADSIVDRPLSLTNVAWAAGITAVGTGSGTISKLVDGANLTGSVSAGTYWQWSAPCTGKGARFDFGLGYAGWVLSATLYSAVGTPYLNAPYQYRLRGGTTTACTDFYGPTVTFPAAQKGSSVVQ